MSVGILIPAEKTTRGPHKILLYLWGLIINPAYKRRELSFLRRIEFSVLHRIKGGGFMKSLKSKNEINQAAFAPNMYDPLGMYGCFPALMTFETYEPLETPTQDADDL